MTQPVDPVTLSRLLEAHTRAATLRSRLASVAPEPFTLANLMVTRAMLAEADALTLSALARATQEAANILHNAPGDRDDLLDTPQWAQYKNYQSQLVPGTGYTLSDWSDYAGQFGIPLVNIDRATHSPQTAIYTRANTLPSSDPSWLAKTRARLDSQIAKQSALYPPDVRADVETYAQLLHETLSMKQVQHEMQDLVCSQGDASLSSAVEALDVATLPAIPSTVLDITTTWGVELEFIFPDATTVHGRTRALSRLLERLGLKEAKDYGAWQIKTDASVTHHNILSQGDSPEIVSPPLTARNLPELHRLLWALGQLGAITNPSTGTHITLALPELSRRNVPTHQAHTRQLALVRNYAQAKAPIEATLPGYRLSGPYRGRLYHDNGPITSIESSLVESTALFAHELEGLADDLRADTVDVLSKAAAIRMNKLYAHNLVEFRQLEGTLDWSRILNFTQTLSNLASWAILDPATTPSVTQKNGLLQTTPPPTRFQLSAHY